uniref:U2266b n=1 Tax=Mycobacterium leprae TaxID=1769 RepID=Q50020_MYCLR|nr:u2266b [Mycobacterium leprae]
MLFDVRADTMDVCLELACHVTESQWQV